MLRAGAARFKCLLFLAPLLLMSAPGAFAAEDIAEKAQLCATCHGKDGVPIDKTIPVIWGQNEGYFYLQLRDFKIGTRKQALMSPIAATLEKEDMLALAAYFSKLEWPNLQQPSAPKDVATKGSVRQRFRRLSRLPPRVLPRRWHHRSSRRSAARISRQDDERVP